jgi:hypothetical protein
VQIHHLVKMIHMIRRIRGLENADIIFSPEANYALDGKRLANELKLARIEGVYCLREDVRGNEGIRMTEFLKKEMVISFNALLMGHHLRWHPFMVSTSTDAEVMRKRLIDEVARYQRQLIYNERDPAALPKEKFHGKVGGASDDMAVTIQIVQKAYEFFRAKPEFYSQLRALYVADNS